MGVRVRVLGFVEVHDGRAPRRIAGTKERMLLALLAARAGEVMSTDAIADALWHEEPPPSAAKSLQVFVARLRKALAAPPAVGVTIEHRGTGYRLVPADAVDATLAENLLASARLAAAAGELEQAASALGRAEQLWRGPSLAEIRDEPAGLAAAHRLDELRADVVTERLDIELQRGRHHEVVADLETACHGHPYREQLWALRMLALHRSARTAEALRAYQDARDALAELGLEPGRNLRELEAAILRDDPSLRIESGDAALPTGEVTIVSTGLEGSTAAWERSPGAMAHAVARHDDLVAGVIARHGGAVVHARSDEGTTLSVFDLAAAAVAAAVDLQRSMLDADWPTDAPLRMAVAVHTGTAELVDLEYVGQTVNRANRLREAGHGGQVLLSGSTTALVRECLPKDVGVRHLGLRRLRDLLLPEDVFQVEHPSLPASFPPLAALDARPHNLPVQATSFVGREELLGTVAAMMRIDARLVTLSGPGGVGKTRLALQTAADLIDDFTDGVWFVGLATIADAREVPGAAAAVLGVRPLAGQTIADAVIEHLAGRRALLVADNMEHVLEAATFLADILAGCPGVKVLATSREWLHLRGEHEVRVEPLDDVAAASLFLERARSVRRDVDDTVAHADVERVCSQLDGMPLAIELVAARLRHLELADVVEQLGVVLDLASDGPRDQPERQRTLRDTVAWSVELLHADERRAFELLAVFHTPSTLDAAAAVLDTDPNSAGLLLAGLADKSLLVEVGDGRFDMLVTLRSYAAELLAASPDAAAHAADAHAGHFAAAARAWFDRRGGIDEDLFDDVHEVDSEALAVLADIRAAATHAASASASDVAPLACQLVAVLQYVDPTDALRWAELGAASRDSAGDWGYWLDFARLSALWAAGRFADAARETTALLSSGGASTRSTRSQAELWALLGVTRWRMGKLDAADDALRRAIELNPYASTPSALLVEQNLGLVIHSRGDLTGAEAQFERVRDLAAAAGDEATAAFAEIRRGTVLLDRGQWTDAAALMERVIDHVPPATLPIATGALVEALVEAGDVAGAVERARRSIARFEADDPSQRLAIWPLQRATLAAALRASGDLELAALTVDEAMPAAVDDVSRAALLHEVGLVAEARGDLGAASRALLDCVAAIGDSPLRLGYQALVDVARVEATRGEADRARRLLVDGVGRYATSGHRPATAQLALALADLLAAAGSVEVAAVLLGVAEVCEEGEGIVARRAASGGAQAGTCVDALADERRRALVSEGRSLPLAGVAARVAG